MSCNFKFPFTITAETLLEKAQKSVQNQGGNFLGDQSSGEFDLTVFGNVIKGSYSVIGQEISIVISEKPFIVPCSMIENYLKQQMGI